MSQLFIFCSCPIISFCVKRAKCSFFIFLTFCDFFGAQNKCPCADNLWDNIFYCILWCISYIYCALLMPLFYQNRLWIITRLAILHGHAMSMSRSSMHQTVLMYWMTCHIMSKITTSSACVRKLKLMTLVQKCTTDFMLHSFNKLGTAIGFFLTQAGNMRIAYGPFHCFISSTWNICLFPVVYSCLTYTLDSL